MKNLILCTFALLWMGTTMGQGYTSTSQEPLLTISSEGVQGNFYLISYEINYAGFVELYVVEHLKEVEDPEEAKETVLIRGSVSASRPGEDLITGRLGIPLKPLKSADEADYTYELHYKGEVYDGSFSLP